VEVVTLRLKDKVAIVTGGSRGIGAAFCEALASEGAKVVVADILDGEAVVKRIERRQGNAIYRRTDVTSAPSIAEMAAQGEAVFGDIDILVNNAALFADLAKKPFQEIGGDEWDRVMAVNVRGPFECAKVVAPAMIKRKSGKIVNIASGTVFKGLVDMLHYVTSKGAVVAMTRCLARELGPYNVCVNAIAPGLTMSEAVIDNPEWTGAPNTATVASRAIRRDQTPTDLLGTLLYLCSDDSNFVTGQTIAVDGGATMR
jgi:NAD(P)-dependent dehydrogenase (short-subunit alcohol dehydrogenase family)